MTRAFRILDDDEQLKHDNPPTFNAIDRKRAFYIPKNFERTLNAIRGSANKVYLLVNFAYFKETAQFYPEFNPRDIRYACKLLNIENKYSAISKASYTSRVQHEKKIIEYFGMQKFNNDIKVQVRNYLQIKLRENRSPRDIFFDIIDFLKDIKCQIPKYSILATLISKAYNEERQQHLSIIETLSSEAKRKLETLVERNDTYSGNIKYQLTHSSRFSHSTKPKKVRENIRRNSDLQDIYNSVSGVFEKLNLTTEQIRSFSTSAELQDVIQLKRKSESLRNLYLTVYTANQYYRLQDILIKSLLNIIKTAFSAAEKQAKDAYYKNQKAREESIDGLAENADSLINQVKRMESIIRDASLDAEAKIAKLSKYIDKQKKSTEDRKKDIDNINIDLIKTSARTLFFKFLEEKATSLKLTCKPIILSLEFDYSCSNSHLAKAIQYYRLNAGSIKNDAPISFLPKQDKHWIVGDDYFNSDLYTMYLFREVCKALIAGDLALMHSHKYLGLERSLISKETFKRNRKKILADTNMTQYGDVEKLLNKLAIDLDETYTSVNSNILNGKNTYIGGNVKEGLTVHSERNTQLSPEEIQLNNTTELYPAENSISLVEALNTVNNACGFLREFGHREHKYIKKRPNNTTFFAVIMSLAHHFKSSTFSKLADAVNKNSVESAMKAYATKENFKRANDLIINFVDKLPLADLFDEEISSSDGQKYIALKESLNSNYSFKYGGKDRVLVEYKSSEARHLSFSPYLINGAELEAHYLFDALFNSGAIRVHSHSTDSHGATLANFALASLTDIEFSPRIKNFQKCELYSLTSISKYNKSKFPISPTRKIKVDLIKEHYENILRIVASLKLGVTTSNQLFRRLNSYSKNNSLYEAIVEFGRIHRTLHILKYMDDKAYRSKIQTQLNKGEHLNNLDKVLAIGAPGYNVANKEDQELIVSAKALLKNVMICWNYMHLSQKIINAKNPIEKLQILHQIKNSWPAVWKHFLIWGKFDLSAENAQDSQNFQVEKMIDPNLLKF